LVMSGASYGATANSQSGTVRYDDGSGDGSHFWSEALRPLSETIPTTPRSISSQIAFVSDIKPLAILGSPWPSRDRPAVEAMLVEPLA
jgi:hypothetical protein